MQALKTQNFDARAVAFWLRDLELERYNVFFARAGLFTFDAITKLSDAESEFFFFCFLCFVLLALLISSAVERLVDGADRQKLKTGLLEMQEFQFYYLATASLLQELGMDRYSQLFALHGISIDVLPYLSEQQLIEMGITSKLDRKHILAAIAKIKLEIPQHGGVWGGSGGGGAGGGGGQMLSDSRGMRKGGAGAKQLTSPSPQAQSRAKAADDRSVEELLKFISGTPDASAVASSSPSSSATKKKNRKKNRNKKAATAAVVVPSPITAVSIDEEEEPAVVAAAAVIKEKIEPKIDLDEEDEEAQNEELDPELKRQVDGEVEEFRRRLEAAGQSSKTKLAPIFYLDSVGTKKNIKH